MTPLDTVVAIETPEHTVFAYRVAGPARRALAYLVDLVICYGAVAVVALAALLASARGLASGDLAAAKASGGVLLVALFAAQWVYFVAWEGSVGRSPGKIATGLRVVTSEGRPIGWGAAALRNLLRAADVLPACYLAGVIAMALGTRFARLGDLVAGTMVIVPASARAARPIELDPPARPEELAAMPAEVTLDADERAALELFLRRRRSLGRGRELELAAMIAERLGRRVGFRHPDPSRLLALVYDRAAHGAP